MRIIRLLWNRLVHEYHIKRYGWHYTEKPMWGKPLFKVKTHYFTKPMDEKQIIIFKRKN